MKQYLLTVLCVGLCTCTVSAQDVIVMRDGNEIQAKILKVSNSEIEYKKWSNQDGPVYSLDKSDVFMIKYTNGEKDVFEATETKNKVSEKQPQGDDAQTVAEALPASDNASFVSQYNTFGHKFKDVKQKDKESTSWIGTLGVTQASVLSTDEIQIDFVQEKDSNRPWKWPYFVKSSEVGTIINGSQRRDFLGYYDIELTNKTSDIIYVDLASSFVMDSDGTYHSYYSGTTTSVSQGGSSGGSLNLGSIASAVGIGGAVGTVAGGVNVGGGSSNSNTTTYANERVIMIPPHGKYVLSKQDFELIKPHFGGYWDILIKSLGESFCGTDVKGLKVGEYKTYTEEDTPASKSYLVSYSKSPDFKSTKQVKFGVYVKDAIGKRWYWGLYGYEGFLKKSIDGVDKTTIIIGFER